MNTKQNISRTLINSSAGLLLILGLSGCIKDNSQLPDMNSVPPIEIEVGDEQNITIEFQDVLKLSPNVKSAGAKNLGYRWTLTTSTDPNKLSKDTIGDKASLEYVMAREKSSSPYVLSFTVIDHDHGDLEYSKSWRVYVNGSIISGLLVADTEDEKTSNLTYIKNSTISRAYSGEEKRLSNVLSVPPLEKVNGLISQLTYSIEGFSIFPHTNHLWATTDQGKLILFDMDNFKTLKTSEDNQLFLYKKNLAQFKVHSIGVAGPTLLASTNEGFYTLMPKANVNQFSLPINVVKPSKPSRGLIACQSYTTTSDDIAVWYDEEAGALTTLTRADKWGQIFGLGELTKSTAFDPNSIPGREALALEISATKPFVFNALLKTKNGDTYEIYEANIAPQPDKPGEIKKGIATAKYSFAPQDIDILKQGKSFFFAKKGAKVLYVITEKDVYAFTFGGTNTVAQRSKSLYHLPANEQAFTMGKLFVQGEFRVCSEYISMLKPKPAELPLNLQAIILVSKAEGGKNTIRIIPIDKDKLGSGNLMTDDKSIIKYEGFNRILDITHIGQ